MVSPANPSSLPKSTPQQEYTNAQDIHAIHDDAMVIDKHSYVVIVDQGTRKTDNRGRASTGMYANSLQVISTFILQVAVSLT
jgi:hypothetical protein